MLIAVWVQTAVLALTAYLIWRYTKSTERYTSETASLRIETVRQSKLMVRPIILPEFSTGLPSILQVRNCGVGCALNVLAFTDVIESAPRRRPHVGFLTAAKRFPRACSMGLTSVFRGFRRAATMSGPKYDTQADWDSQKRIKKQLEPRRDFKTTVSDAVKTIAVLFGIVLLIGYGSDLYSGLDDMGWIPHNRVVTVAAKSSSWIVGEYKNCRSVATEPVQDIAYLLCDDTSEAHDLKATFWGTSDTKRARMWNCQRTEDFFTREDSLSCKRR